MKIAKLITIMQLLMITFAACKSKNKKNENNSSDHRDLHTDVNAEQYSDKVNNGTIKTDTLKGSPKRNAMGFINGIHVHIVYGSPGVKGRIIWGGLVSFDHLWVTGAHNATKISISRDVNINGKNLKAGQYAFFTIPGKKTWTLIFNARAEQHLTDNYNQNEDVLRIRVVPEQLSVPVQRLTYTVNETSHKEGKVSMEWDKIRITYSITATK